MRNNILEIVAAFIFGMAMGAILMVCIIDFTEAGGPAGERRIQQEAVDNGVAEWGVTTNGVPYFEWKKFDE